VHDPRYVNAEFLGVVTGVKVPRLLKKKVLGFGALVGAIAHSSLKRRFPPLIVGGVVEFEEAEVLEL
jgi:hypothetical protein